MVDKKLYNRQYRQRNRLRIKETMYLWKELNKEKIIVYMRQYRLKNRERIVQKQREWIGKNRERIRMVSKLYKLKNPNWSKLKQKKYYNKYRKEILEKNKSYRFNNKEKIRFLRKRRKALMRSGGKLTIKTIQRIYEDNIKKYGTLTCIYCLIPILFGKDTLEHKIPLIRGGTNEYYNLAVACESCNSSKQSKTEEEYRKEILL